MPATVNNGQNNSCQNRNAYEFIAEVENRADLMFLRLPRRIICAKELLGWTAWREEFLRGGDDYWTNGTRPSRTVGHVVENQIAVFAPFGRNFAKRLAYRNLGNRRT